MRSEQEIKEHLEQFLKDNPKAWIYNQNNMNNPALQAIYQTTIRELAWVLEINESEVI